jgi:hypothetical protein
MIIFCGGCGGGYWREVGLVLLYSRLDILLRPGQDAVEWALHCVWQNA